MGRFLRGAALPFAAFLALLAAGCDVKITRGDRAEAPPPEIAALGLGDGYHVREMSEAEVDRFCRAWGVDANDEYNRRRIRACVIPALRAVVLPPNAPEDVRVHEFAHSQGYQHAPNGRGWVAMTGNALRTATTNALKGTR